MGRTHPWNQLAREGAKELIRLVGTQEFINTWLTLHLILVGY